MGNTGGFTDFLAPTAYGSMTLYDVAVWALQRMVLTGHQAAYWVLLYLWLNSVVETVASFALASRESKFAVTQLTALFSISLWDKGYFDRDHWDELLRLTKHRGDRPNWHRFRDLDISLNSWFHILEAADILLKRHGQPKLVFTPYK